MAKFAALKPEIYKYFINDGDEKKKEKKNLKLKLKDYKNCLEASQFEN